MALRDTDRRPLFPWPSIAEPDLPSAPKRQRLPLCITFIYRARRILCRVLRDDAGNGIGLMFDCPQCGQWCQFPTWPSSASAIVPFATGAVSIEGCLRCFTPGCDFHVGILNGQATDHKSGRS